MAPILAEIRDRLLKACPSISCIVLFGSRARGDAIGGSDYDLLIVAPTEQPANTLAARLRLALWDVPAAFDVIVVTPAEFETTMGFRSGIVHQAMEEGLVLHEAA